VNAATRWSASRRRRRVPRKRRISRRRRRSRRRCGWWRWARQPFRSARDSGGRRACRGHAPGGSRRGGPRDGRQGAQPDQAAAQGGGGGGGGGRAGGRGGRGAVTGIAGVSRPYTYAELINGQGGLTPLLFAARQGDLDSARALLDAGAAVNTVSGGDNTSPLLMAVINGYFDLAAYLIERGANPSLASDNGVTPLYAAINMQWAPRALYPQPRTHLQQKLTYLDFMKRLLDKKVDPNARLVKKVWYQEYNFPLLGVDEIGASPFWRAAYAADVEAMKLLVAHGADPTSRRSSRPGVRAPATRRARDHRRRVGIAAGARLPAGHPAAACPPPAPATAKASPATRTAPRPAGSLPR
jgi:hypothetical protein